MMKHSTQFLFRPFRLIDRMLRRARWYKRLPIFLQKTLAIFLTFSIVFTGTGIVYLFNPWGNTAEAAWFNDNWGYRTLLTLPTHSASENNVYISTTIDTATLITAGKLQSDCGDLRFTKQNGEILPFYIQGTCNQADTLITVNFNTYPAGTIPIYYYYGNPSAANGFSTANFTTSASNNSTTINLQVGAAGNDGSDVVGDATFHTTGHPDDGTPWTSTSYIGTGGKNASGSVITTGFRFTSVTIPQGATISSSSFDLRNEYSSGSPGYSTNVKTLVYGSKQTTVSAVFSDSNLPRNITKTTASATWNSASEAMSTDTWFSATASNQPPSITSITQEVVNQTGWVSGNSLALIITDNGSTTDWWWQPRGYEAAAASAAKFATTFQLLSPTVGSEEKGPSPVGYWKFDEGQGTTANDSTTNNNDGTLTGSPPWQTEDQCISGKCLYFTAPSSGGGGGSDVTIENSVDANGEFEHNQHGIVWTSSEVGYVFYINGATGAPVYKKTTDGGQTWGSQVAINGTTAGGNISIWYDRWTPSDTGTTIHIAFRNDSTNTLKYSSLNTSTDTLGTIYTIHTQSVSQPWSWNGNRFSITKSRGGYLFVMSREEVGATTAFERSTNGGQTWTTRTSFIEDGEDREMLLPGNDTDTNDIAVVQMDDSADTVYYAMYDDSLNSWGTKKTIGSLEATDYCDDCWGMDVTVRHSDGKGIVSWWTAIDNAGADLKVAELTLTSAGTATVLTDVRTNSDNSGEAGIFIDNNSDDIYVAYLRSASAITWATGTTKDVYYKKSTDGGTTWGSETQFNTTQANLLTVSAGFGIASGDSGRFMPVWFNATLNDFITNYENSIQFPPLSYISVSNTISNVQSVSFWAKPNTLGSTTPLIDLNGTAKITTDSSGVLSATGFTSPTIYVNGQIGTTITANTWSFVTITTGTGISASAIQMGTDGTVNLTGFLDEVKFYNFALSADQVKTNYNARGNPEGVASVLGTNTQNMPAALSKGLVGYWEMDESATPSLDSSGNSHSGTWNNNVAATIGKFANAVDFPDATDDYIEVTRTTALEPANSLTVSAWVKAPAQSNFGRIISHGSSTQGYELILQTSGAGSKMEFNLGIGGVEYDVFSNGSVADSLWHHVTGTYDGKTMRLYIDGVLQTDTQAITGSVGYSASNNLRMGVQENTTSNDYDGLLDEARIYNRTLSGNEVSQLYSWAPGPVGYWKLEEKTGSTAYDNSSNANDLTWTNTPTSTIGKYGTAINLAGSNQHLIRADDADFDFGDDTSFSYETWIKHTTASAQEVILSKYNEAGYKLIMESDGDLTCALDYDSTWTPTDSITSTAATYDDSKWHHIACVKDGASSLSLYIDGVLIGSDSSLTATNTVTNSDPLYIGIDADGTSLDFVGQVDEPKIYNYARTQAQAIEDMNAGHPAPGSPVGTPIGHWKFDEGAANTCSGGSNDTCNSGSQGSNLDGAFDATNPPSYTNTAKFGKALSFDGTNDYLSAGSDSSIDALPSASGLTISTWIYPTSEGEGNDGWIIGKASNAACASGWCLRFYASGTNALDFFVDYATTDLRVLTSDNVITLNAWNHVVLSWNGSTTASNVDIYVNGREVSYGTQTSASGAYQSDAVQTLQIGNVAAGTDTFAGTIDEMKLYSTALTQPQVLLDMNRGSSQVLGGLSDNSTAGQVQSASQEYCIPGDSTTCTGPVGRWDFDSQNGGTHFDTSGNGNNCDDWQGQLLVVGKIGKADNVVDSVGGTLGCGNGATVINLPDNGMTFEGWIYPRSEGDFGGGMIAGKTAYNATGWELRFDSNGTNALKFHSDYSTTDFDRVTADNTITLNAWNHIVFTWTGGAAYTTSHFYINGVEATYNTAASSDGVGSRVSDATEDLGFGDDDGGTGTFDGKFDQFRIFNYVRTPAQIVYNYNRGAPIAHWKMDECQGTTINDSAGNSYTGTLTNATAGTCTTSGAWFNGVTGKRNYSVDLDTDDYIQVSDTANLRFDAATADFSLFAWVKRASNGEMNVISKEDADNDGYRLQFTSGNVVRCSVDSIDIDSTVTITDTNWHLVGCTIDRDGNGKVYIDGQANGTATAISSEVMATTAALRLGTRAYTAANYLDGQLDETRIYNYALTAGQVKLLYSNGATRFGPVTGSP